MRSIAKRGWTALGAAIVLTPLLAACSAVGQRDVGTAWDRKVYWFSYVAGDDIHKTCAPGTPDRFRLIYNGIYDQQVRLYDIDGLQRVLSVSVSRPTSLFRLTVSGDDPLAAWIAARSQAQLSPADYDRLMAAFTQSGLFAPPPVGLDLPARSYFWTAAFCHDGHFGFTAWRYPSDGFAHINFDKILFAFDRTGQALAAPGPIPLDPVWESERAQGQVEDFTLTVGRAGLVR